MAAKLRLRLDNGAIVSADKGLVDPQTAFKDGLLTEAHLLRAQALVCSAHALLPEDLNPLRSVSAGSKRSADTRVEADGKRARSGGAPLGNGLHDTAAANGLGTLESPQSVGPPGGLVPPAPAAAAPPVAAAPPPPAPPVFNWVPVAERIVQMVLDGFGQSAWIFHEPVNGALVRDYYRIIKQPICFKQIKEKLRRRQYVSPEQFYSDVDLIWYNCFTYNRPGHEVHTLGLRGEAKWVQEWAASAFKDLPVQMRPRPVVVAPQPIYAAAPALPPKKQQRSGAPKAARAPAPPRPRAPPAGAPHAGGVTRTKSVNSYRAYQALPPEKQAQLAEALQDEAVMAEKMDGVVQILMQANELPTNENGEVELDLSAVSPATVWSLYEFVFGAAAAAAPFGGGAAPARSGGFKVEEDSDYEPDEDEDD
eukprot:scaffold12.g7918.t1